MDAIMGIANRHGIPVIEDNAQCFLGTYKGKVSGSFGTISSWSFENTKHISCGEGGIITTNDAILAERIRKFAGHGFKNLSATEGRVRLNQEVFQNPNYKRHDSIGWNYRLPEFNAAVALAQLERLDELVDLRKMAAEAFLNVMSDVDYFVPQYTPSDRTNAFYTLGVRYFGNESIGVSWEDFRKSYIARGGDGIYGAWSVPYLEPAIAEGTFQSRNPIIYEGVAYERGLCPVAEKIQPSLMQFKTNYRSAKLAKKKAKILRETILSLKK
jgi:perosamine synthetase